MKPTGPRFVMSVVASHRVLDEVGRSADQPGDEHRHDREAHHDEASGTTRTRQSSGFHQRYRGPRSICW